LSRLKKTQLYCFRLVLLSYNYTQLHTWQGCL